MNHMLIPRREPGQPESVRPPMIYVEKQVKWEYKQIVRNLENEKPLDEMELDLLGKDGWEMTGIAQQSLTIYFYFKRQTET